MTMPSRSLTPRLMLSLTCLLLAGAAAPAGDRVWSWKNASGNSAYADPGGLNATLTPSSLQQALPHSLAEREEVRDGSSYDVYVRNRTGGPLEVALSLDNDAQVATPEQSMHQLLAPLERALLARFEPGPGRGPKYSLRVVPGDPHAIPDEIVYSLPLDEDSPWEFGQAFHGGFSHNDEQNLYAVDLIVPEGTPVLAARDGIVTLVESGYGRGGLNRKQDATRANQIMVLHPDGTMAVYAHLQQNGVAVEVGDRVGIGQLIAYSGNSGFSSGPHLHFCLQVNVGMRLVSIPFRMVTARGFLPLPHK